MFAACYLLSRSPYTLFYFILSASGLFEFILLDSNNDYSSTNIKPAVNLSQPNETGLKGVLYQQDLIDCSSSRNNSNSTNMLLLNSNGDTSNIPVIPRSLPRVALIHQMKKNGCNIIDLILKAQTEGAVGAIVYGLSDVETNAVFIPTGTAVAITVYFVDMRTGEDLLSKIVTYEKIQPTRIDEVVTARPYVRVLLLPASLGTINAWEITLLIVSILLVTSFLASVIMHWHLWRKRKRQEYLVEQGLIPIPVEMLPMGKHIFEESKLEEYFPSENLDDEKLLNLNNSSNEPLLCVVCLENLTIGSKIRTLPCKHIYHCHCIDPWLTTKCAECPLCKYDCNLVAKSDGEGTVSALTAGNTSNATATENADGQY
ncbi:hypothetical protein BDF20DRAFT_909568 [Mycotypha africana]|uniref:uncharacterized protein n=1 Tax=Mycotypha africana TaxID=64632 RepID=UPI002301AB07|nr:uncharacterized protein BDF20DRAFT_909568 [Mycotypha africana]KAI8991843.1 hypothetical protein BDF20DRAFT_909568 [Mycotypha africana]